VYALNSFGKLTDMGNIEIQTSSLPSDDPSLALSTIEILRRADAMGLIERRITHLDESTVQDLEMDMVKAGIDDGKRCSNLNDNHKQNPAPLSKRLEKINNLLKHCPMPEYEWQNLNGILELELLARLVGISQSPAQSYLTGSSRTPKTVADRLHYLSFVVTDLAGSYNNTGIQRWFDRKRTLLDGRTPAQMLGECWSPNDEGARRVQALSHALTVFPVT